MKWYKWLLLVLVAASGCKKDPMVEDPEAKDLWEKVSPEVYDPIFRTGTGNLHMNDAGELYYIKKGSYATYCWCGDQDGTNWQKFTIDSGSLNYGWIFITRQDAMDNLWVLLDYRLVKITGCGSSESFVTASRDTSHYSDLFNRFVDMQIVDGTPWLLHSKWGMYRYDFALDSLVHVATEPFHYLGDSANFNISSSLGIIGNDIMVSVSNGNVWRYSSPFGEFIPIFLMYCEECGYSNLRVAPNGDAIGYVHYPDGSRGWRNLSNSLSPMTTLPMDESPYYFNKTTLDRNAQFAYYSTSPIPESYIGMQPLAGEPLIVNARDAVEEGSVPVIDPAFSYSNELFVATGLGIYRYVGRDE